MASLTASRRVIDFRLRPPLRGLQGLSIWDRETIARFAKVQGIQPARSALARSMEMLAEEMADAGIVAGVIDGRQVGAWPGDVSNADLATIVDDYRGIFFALVGVNPHRGLASLREAEMYLRDFAFSGIAIDAGLYVPPLLADDERLFPYYELCIGYDVPAVLPIGVFDGPTVSWASAIPVDQIASRYPTLKLVVSHGCWPYVAELCGVVCRRPNVYMMPDMYYHGMPGHEMLTAAMSTFAQDRFLFATAYPSRPLGLTVDQYSALPVAKETLDLVCYENAARLLKLIPSNDSSDKLEFLPTQ